MWVKVKEKMTRDQAQVRAIEILNEQGHGEPMKQTREMRLEYTPDGAYWHVEVLLFQKFKEDV